MRNPLLDKEFLKALDEQRHRETFAKIIALNLQEHPIEEITGKVTGGSLNIDGSSKIRRSCSLNLIADEVNITNYYWGMNSKFKLEIGLKNTIDPQYPEIIWFPQGTYAITGFNTSQSVNNFGISIQGRDKMALLNGELGGVIGSLSADFGVLEEIVDVVNPDGSIDEEIVYTDIPIKDIITDIVHHYGKEPFHNIVINDLDDYGLELLEFLGDNNLNDGESRMYLAVDVITNEVTQIYTNPDTIVQEVELKNGVWTSIAGKEYKISKVPVYDPRATLDLGNAGGNLVITKVKIKGTDGVLSDNVYTIINVEPGQTCGYRLCDLIYNGQLVANVGDAVTSVLDKIVGMLGDFEYFYDLDGRFIFQRKATTTYVSWNNIVNGTDEEQYVENAAMTQPWEYIFEGGKIINSFTNNPNLANVKNDFSIWGTRPGVSGDSVPVHMRYAIDKKPVYYKTIDGSIYVADKNIYQKLFDDKKEEIIANEIAKIKGYRPIRTLNNIIPGLDVPNQLPDGSWSAGWWDIRDWSEYYTMLTTGKNVEDITDDDPGRPKGTMKWFARNDWEGCVPAYRIPGYENDTSGKYVWIVTLKSDGTISLNHNSQSPAVSPRESKFYDISEVTIDANGKYKVTSSISNPSNPQKKMIYYPYAYCNDTHTYDYFRWEEMENNGSVVFFYNPTFPQGTYDEVIKDAVDNAVEAFERDNKIHYVDWRELIYRMALDYYKYYKYSANQQTINHRMVPVTFGDEDKYYKNYYYYLDKNNNYVMSTAITPDEDVQYYKLINGDNFISEVRKNNIEYYPSGYTGYEQYYQDMQGFWGQVYNSQPVHDFLSLSQEDAIGMKTFTEQKVTRAEIEIEKEKALLNKRKELDDFIESERRRFIDLNWAESSITENLNKLKSESNTAYDLYKREQENIARVAKNNVNEVSQIWVNRYFKKYDPAVDIDFDKTLLYYIYTETKANSPNKGKTFLRRWLDDPALSWDNLVERFCWKRNAINTNQIGLCYESSNGDIEYTITESQPKKDPVDPTKNAVNKYGDIIYEDVQVKKKFILIKSELIFDGKGQLGVNWKEFINKNRDALTPYSLPEYVSKQELWVRELKNNKIVMTPLMDKITPDTASKTYYYRTTDINDYIPIRDLDTNIKQFYYKTEVRDGNVYYIKELYPRIPGLVFDRLGKEVYTKTPKKDANGNYIKDAQGNIQYEEIQQTSSFTNYFYNEFYEFYLDCEGEDIRFWKRDILYYPEELNFWFDFLDTNGEFSKFAVNAIGDRPKAVNDSNVKAIYFREIPNLIWLDTEQQAQKDALKPIKSGYTLVNLPDQIKDLMTVSSQGKDAKTVLDGFLNSFTNAAESISLTCLPIYYLQPNTKIKVCDESSGINGTYVLQRITIPLTYNGMMSISGVKYIENIY